MNVDVHCSEMAGTMMNKRTAKALGDFIERYGIKKTVLARDIGVTRVELYAYLTPDKYPQINLATQKRDRIDTWVRSNVLRRRAA